MRNIRDIFFKNKVRETHVRCCSSSLENDEAGGIQMDQHHTELIVWGVKS